MFHVERSVCFPLYVRCFALSLAVLWVSWSCASGCFVEVLWAVLQKCYGLFCAPFGSCVWSFSGCLAKGFLSLSNIASLVW